VAGHTEYAEATGLRDGGGHVAAVGEREQRKFETEILG
jgi:hypothetical protein